MLFRIRHKTLGGHVHMRVFVGPGSLSLALSGELVMRLDEFAAFKREIDAGQDAKLGGDIEFVKDE